MSPDAVAALINVASDAVKIIGPAAIAAIAAYKVAQVQLTAKLKELTSGSELKARASFFSYYRERGEYLRSAAAEAGRELGKLYGIVSASEDDTPDDRNLIQAFGSFVEVISNMLPLEGAITQVEMEAAGLQNAPQYSRLRELLATTEWLVSATTKEAVLNRLGAIIKLYSYLMHCNQVIVEARMKEVFKPFLDKTRNQRTKN
jgi:hypothetical protein